MRLSSADQEKIADLYEKIIMEGMSVGNLTGGVPTTGGEIENSDAYATGDTRIPKVLGALQSRKGPVKRKKLKMRGKRSKTAKK